jgi:glycosyltransferase involved in cell wall biosynthesis
VKVVIVAPDGGRDVLQPHLDKLLPALRRRGYTVEFIGWDRASQWPRRSSHDGVGYTMVLRGGGYSSRRLLLWMPLWYAAATLKLARRAARDDEVLMAMDFEAALPAAVAGLVRGHRFIYNCRDNVSMRYRLPRGASRMLDWIDGRVMGRASAVIFPDEVRVPPDAPPHTVIVRNCAPEVELEGTPDPSALTVYALGNLRRDRGVELLLDAANEVEGCRVLAAGKCRDAKLAARLEGEADYRGVLSPTEALALCGEADVVFTFYEPSLEINRRAVSNKWSDAMMAGRPILINTELAKARWVLDSGIGYGCPYAAGELAQALGEIAANRDEARRRGSRGRALWESGYRWDVMEERVVELIERAPGRAAVP